MLSPLELCGSRVYTPGPGGERGVILIWIKTSRPVPFYVLFSQQPARESPMTYLDPADTDTIKHIGYNVGALIGLAFLLIAIVAVVV